MTIGGYKLNNLMSNSTQNKVFNDLPEKDQKDIIKGAMKHAKKLQDEVLDRKKQIGNEVDSVLKGRNIKIVGTQNDEIEVDGETYTKWDTQNDEIGKMEKAIDEGFAESERDLKDKKTPLDQPTQNDWEKVKTFGDFIDELFCKQNNPYEPIKDASPYHRYRNLCALVNNEIHEKMKGDRFYEENKHELWRVVENTVAATLYIQSQIKDKSSELADARREMIDKVEKIPHKEIIIETKGGQVNCHDCKMLPKSPFCRHAQGWNDACRHILATLREEEGNV